GGRRGGGPGGGGSGTGGDGGKGGGGGEARGEGFGARAGRRGEDRPVRVTSQPLARSPGGAPSHQEPGHLVNATAASAAEANNCRRADLAVIHPRCCHSRPASESPAITTSPNGMER